MHRLNSVVRGRPAACAGLSAALLLLFTLHAQPPAQSPELHLLPVQGNVYMLVGAGGNIAVQSGKDGVLLVDSGLAQFAPQIMAAIRTLSKDPIRYIVNTHVHADHTGGNAALVKLGGTGGNPGPTLVVAHLGVQERMAAPPLANQQPAAHDGWPNDTYSTPYKDFFFNNEAVVVTYIPAAHTDGDSIVFFRRSDVIATGDVFTPGHYPGIVLEQGGSVQGLIAGLNKILEITVPAKYQEGGTYVIPGHGRLCEEADVVEYRDMVTIIRDRVQDLISKGMTLEQVKAAKPSLDYDTQYAGSPDTFVEALYKSLKQ